MILRYYILAMNLALFIAGCDDDASDNAGDNANCVQIIEVDTTRGACSESLSYSNEVTFSSSGDLRTITANNIPQHDVGLFGNQIGSLNPNAIMPQNSSYEIDLTPSKASSLTQLLDNGPTYSFGILFNGVEVDPVAAEPWPHTKPVTASHNWEWNLEASMVNIGLDCNNAHVQPTGKYHYHGTPGLYLVSLSNNVTDMLHIGYAADGFPIYYKYGYTNANDSNSLLMTLSPSYQLKSGERPGDGNTAPCGEYTGVYTADFEYIAGLGDLDECNGRDGVTPEFPNGTYYYVITDSYPGIPRCFVGTPLLDFKIGP